METTKLLSSQMCKREVLTSPPFVAWAERMRPGWDLGGSGAPVLIHRKLWEWLFITQALAERGVLREGSRGLGFGVGQEPLVAMFAAMGCEIVATDQTEAGAAAGGWADDRQFAGGLDLLNRYELCDPEVFARRVTFRTVDMNAVPSDLRGFDFTWSSCAFEHLGSIGRGLDFVRRQMACLRPGGVAVHTTEFNVGSDTETIDDEATVLFRRRDLEGLGRWLRRRGHRVDLDFEPGTTPDDRHVDVPPFSDVHLRTRVLAYTTTSYGLIVTRRRLGRARHAPPR
jgi:hypothetical protein